MRRITFTRLILSFVVPLSLGNSSFGSAFPTQLTGDFIATVAEGADVPRCIEGLAAKPGIQITHVLDSLGLVLFAAHDAVTEDLWMDCIVSIEGDQVFFPMPSVRVGN